MNSCVALTVVVLVAMLNGSTAGVVPVLPASAPLVAAAAPIAYTHAVPYNFPPYASRVDINTRNLAAPVLAPYIAHAPLTAVHTAALI
ncbi:hypothetical protein KM043_011493 [Ampulex compressa]|nr:hypothetical protein KM043_011493 [Ampulex compressa]